MVTSPAPSRGVASRVKKSRLIAAKPPRPGARPEDPSRFGTGRFATRSLNDQRICYSANTFKSKTTGTVVPLTIVTGTRTLVASLAVATPLSFTTA
jgi:hypothetical protein